KEDLSKTMRTAVGGQSGQSSRGAHGDGGEWKDNERGGQSVQHDHFVLTRSYLLAQIFGRAANHKSREKDSDCGGHDHAVQTSSETAEYELSEQHVYQQHHAAERGVAVVHGVV